MKYCGKNSSELLPCHTVDDEVDGAVEDSQVASYHVHQVLPFRTKVLSSGRVETINHQVVPGITFMQRVEPSKCTKTESHGQVQHHRQETQTRNSVKLINDASCGAFGELVTPSVAGHGYQNK